MKTVLFGNNKSVNEAIIEIIESALEANFVVIEFDRHPLAFELMSLYNAELVIIDLTSKSNNNHIFIREIKELAPQCKIILLNIYNQKILIKQLIQDGASAYLQIDVLHNHLLTAIETIMQDKTYIAVG